MYSTDNYVGVFNITFYNPRKEVIPTVSITRSTIVLGAYASRHFISRKIEHIKLGYDRAFNIIVIAPTNEKDDCHMKFPQSLKDKRHSERTYIKAGPAFKAWKLDINRLLNDKKAFSFPAFWHEDANFLIIDLDPKETKKPWYKEQNEEGKP